MADEAQVLTLSEAKAQNKAEEEALLKAAAGDIDGEAALKAAADKAEEEAALKVAEEEAALKAAADEKALKTGDIEGKPGEVEAFMQADDDPPVAAINPSEAKKIRLKYQKPLREATDRVAKLEQELETLKKQGAPAPAAQTGKPKRESFKTEADFIEALTDWKIETRVATATSTQIAAQRKAAQEREEARIEEVVDTHYLRASKLAEKSGISAELYQAADQRVRDAVETKFPKAGDAIVNKLISILGDGSEKVFYHLGVNKAKLQKFMDTFDVDSGLTTATFLASLNAELKPPVKAQSKAPAPAAHAAGDTNNAPSVEKLKRDYQEAHRKGDTQKAFNLKKQAKALKIVTKDW